MAEGGMAAGATVPHRSALGSAQSVKMCFTDKTACQVSPSLTAVENLLSPINTLTDEQQSFTDHTTAVHMLAYARGLKRMLPRNKREDCLRVLKRLLHDLSDDEALADTLRVLNSLQYNKAQLQANKLGPVLHTLSHGAEEVAAEAQQALQQFQTCAPTSEHHIRA